MKFIILSLLLTSSYISQSQSNQPYHEPYRPQIHFSPKAHWMNDPNGLVYNDGIYHLFFQYYPGSTVWGPMHWGHATSPDLIHWTEQPIALYPDNLGYIFSGSAVSDINNTSGFGKNGKTPLVAIYTNHDPKGEKAGKNNYQNQSIAYSTDNGKTWTKYKNNPVLKNPGITDFRDPKVSWYEKDHKWIMTLATKDRITFYSSPDLKEWKKESEFGEKSGAHGGVWECPDLFPMNLEGKQIWILIVNINPGGPNGGSATQYFTGDFDGQTFTPDAETTKWLDYGPDEYAGITYSNTGDRKIFLGWMSNWDYATIVPTKNWRSAMTIPRELGITKLKDTIRITSAPIKELTSISSSVKTSSDVSVIADNISIDSKINSPYQIKFSPDSIKDFTLIFSNDAGEELSAGYDKLSNQYFIDRTKAGVSDFKKTFAARATAPGFNDSKNTQCTFIIDNASIEFFADNGLTTMTSIFFPKQLLNHIRIQSKDGITLKSFEIDSLKSIWK